MIDTGQFSPEQTAFLVLYSQLKSPDIFGDQQAMEETAWLVLRLRGQEARVAITQALQFGATFEQETGTELEGW